MKKPKVPKAKHPSEVNGGFNSTGGEELYNLLWGLQGRVSKLEGGFVIVIVLLAAVLAKLQGFY